MHAERYAVPAETAAVINRARAEGRRVVAVGTTTVRTLESAWDGQQVQAGEGDTRIFITPGTPVQRAGSADHQPASAGQHIAAAGGGLRGRGSASKRAYDAALAGEYRFYSLGDAMLLENQRNG